MSKLEMLKEINDLEIQGLMCDEGCDCDTCSKDCGHYHYDGDGKGHYDCDSDDTSWT